MNGMCTQRTKKRETPHPLKEEKAKIEQKVAQCHSVTKETDVGGEKETQYVFSKEKCMGYQSPVCKAAGTHRVHSPAPHTQKKKKRVANAFWGEHISLKKQQSKAKQTNFLKMCFKEKICFYQQKLKCVFQETPAWEFSLPWKYFWHGL